MKIYKKTTINLINVTINAQRGGVKKVDLKGKVFNIHWQQLPILGPAFVSHQESTNLYIKYKSYIKYNHESKKQACWTIIYKQLFSFTMVFAFLVYLYIWKSYRYLLLCDLFLSPCTSNMFLNCYWTNRL